MRAKTLADKYREEYKRYYYITPTSYLVLLESFKELLAKKRNEIDTVIMKYDKGIS